MAESTSPFNFLWHALLLPSKNPKLFSNIFLIFIISHGFLYMAAFQLSIAPFVSTSTEVARIVPTSPEFTELILNILKAIPIKLLICQFLYYVFLYVISSFLVIIAYYANSTTYLGEILTLEEVLKNVKGIIAGPLITQLVVALSGIIYLIFFAVLCFAVISWSFSFNFYIGSWVFAIPLALLAFLLVYLAIITQFVVALFGVMYLIVFVVFAVINFATLSWNVSIIFNISSRLLLIPLACLALLLVYLAEIWSMSMAISVIEPNVYGTDAIMHVARLLKGKKQQVFLLFFALSIASCIMLIFIIMIFASGSKASILVLGLLYHLLQQVASLYSTMAITVLYYECNQSNGGTATNYTLLATSTV